MFDFSLVWGCDKKETTSGGWNNDRAPSREGHFFDGGKDWNLAHDLVAASA
jgi:hypothetical protein